MERRTPESAQEEPLATDSLLRRQRRSDGRVVQDSVSPSLNDIALLGIIDQSHNRNNHYAHSSLLRLVAAEETETINTDRQ